MIDFYDSWIIKILLWILPYRIVESLFFSVGFVDSAELHFPGEHREALHTRVIAVRGDKKGFVHTWVVTTRE